MQGNTPAYHVRQLPDDAAPRGGADGIAWIELTCPWPGCDHPFTRARDVVEDYAGATVHCPSCGLPAHYPVVLPDANPS